MDDKTLEDKLDKLIRVTTRTETQVKALMDAEPEKRLTKLETRSKVLQWVGGVAMSAMGLVLTYIKISQS